MIVYLKNPATGEFEKSGSVPGDVRVQIATDTGKPAGDYTLDAALALVEGMIAAKKKYYRYEIHPSKASQLKHTPKAKAAPKAKATPKAARKETGKQRHARLKAEGTCTACGKRKAAPKAVAKGGGFYSECKTCRSYYSDWARNHANGKR